MGNTLLIRRYAGKDFISLVPLLKQLWPNKKIDIKAVRELLLRQNKKRKSHLILVAEQNQEISGLVTLSWRLNIYSEGYLACIDELVVDEKCRKKGIGGKMIEEVFRFCEKQNIKGVYLTSAFHREDAHVFYNRKGLEKISYKFEKHFGRKRNS